MRYKELSEKDDKLKISLGVGDEVRMGKFRNRKATIKGFDKDKKNQPTVKTTKGEKKALTFDVEKLKDKDE